MFDSIFIPARGGLLRGTQLGDKLDAVLARETDDVSVNDSPDRFTLTVSGKAHPAHELSYNVYYIYDAERCVRSMSISVQYNQYIDSLPPFADFSELLKELAASLKQRYGKPEAVEEKVRPAGKDKFEKWFPKDGPLKKVLLVTYAEPKNKIKKAFRLDLSSSA